jgi:hypothetical protein
LRITWASQFAGLATPAFTALARCFTKLVDVAPAKSSAHVAIGNRAFLVALLSQKSLLALAHGCVARLIHFAFAMAMANHFLVGILHTRAGELAELAQAGVVATA